MSTRSGDAGVVYCLTAFKRPTSGQIERYMKRNGWEFACFYGDTDAKGRHKWVTYHKGDQWIDVPNWVDALDWGRRVGELIADLAEFNGSHDAGFVCKAMLEEKEDE